MDTHVKISGVWKRVNKIHVKVGGVWKAVQAAYIKTGGNWKQTYVDLTLSADKSSVSGSGTGFAACGNPGVTDVVTVTPDGGVGPYTYAWARVGAAASSGPYAATAPTGISTAFVDSDSSVCQVDAVTTEIWRCTVTDSNDVEATVDVTVELTWTDLT